VCHMPAVRMADRDKGQHTGCFFRGFRLRRFPKVTRLQRMGLRARLCHQIEKEGLGNRTRTFVGNVKDRRRRNKNGERAEYGPF